MVFEAAADLGGVFDGGGSLNPGANLLGPLSENNQGAPLPSASASEQIPELVRAASAAPLTATESAPLVPPILRLQGRTIEDANATLILDQDFLEDPLNSANQIFYWQSSDPIHGMREASVQTQPGTMDVVRFFEGNESEPDRVLFIGEADGLTISANFFFGTLNWGSARATGSEDVNLVTEPDSETYENPRVCPSEDCSESPTKGAEASNYTNSGEFTWSETDLYIPGRSSSSLHYSFSRDYRSQFDNDGPLGHNWDHEYFQRLEVQIDGSIVHKNGLRQKDRYLSDGAGGFISPAEFFTELKRNEDDGSFTLRESDGTVKTFDSDGQLMEIRDRNDNFMSFLYDNPDRPDQLTQVIDTMGRAIDYFYIDSGVNEGRLDRIEDFIGRVVDFTYDERGDLVEVTSPAVTGTPNGNDFPDGKTTRYTYSSGSSNEALNHNLLTITNPNEVANGGGPVLINRYGNNRFEFDKILSQTHGGTNDSEVEAGGTYEYEYEQLAQGLTGDPNQVVSRTTEIDRNGNKTVWEYNPLGYIVNQQEFTKGLREGEPEFFETTNEYNADGRLTLQTDPEDNVMPNDYDDESNSRFAQGNLLTSQELPGPRGGDQDFIKTKSVYEPIYQQVARSVDPRGLDPSFIPPLPDPLGRTQEERYTTTYFFDYQEAPEEQVLPLLAEELGVSVPEVEMLLDDAGIELGLGDLNEDGIISTSIAGNVVRMEEPAAVLLAGSNQAAIEGGQIQSIVTLYEYNQFGQQTAIVDPEGNRHEYEYYSETDPDGDGIPSPVPPDGRVLDPTTGGYLAVEIQDAAQRNPANNFNSGLPIRPANNGSGAPPTQIETEYEYDPVGNIIGITDGRGIRTEYVVNELNQVVRTIRAAEVPDSGAGNPDEPLDLVAFAYIEDTFYDHNDNVVKRSIEDRGDTSNTGGFVDYTYTYDILDNVVTETQEVDVDTILVTQSRYDRNENLTFTLYPEGNATSAVYDERDLLFVSTRGAFEATPETLSPPPATNPDPATREERPYDVRGGIPCQCTTYNYDGNRNIIEMIDSDDTDLSPDNNGKIGGTDEEGDITLFVYDGYDRRIATIDAVGNRTEVNYDPVSNVVRERTFGPIGGISPTNNFGSDNVLLSEMTYLHDELNRQFQQDYSLFVANGVTTVRPPEIADGSLTPGDGKVTMRTEYDRKSRVTFTVEDDEDTYATLYDGADRQIKTTDPEGNMVEYAYDDNDNLIETKETDVSQVAGVADQEFLTTYFYDSLNRLQRTTDNIGQTMFYRYDSRDNLVAMADALGPVSGETIDRRAFSVGALTVNAINDFGNVTRYFYDGINRQVREEQILTNLLLSPNNISPDSTFSGDGIHIGANIFGQKDVMGEIESFTPPPDPTQGGGDGIIRTGYVYDGNSLLSALIDDQGNVTVYLYDNLDRQVTETKGLTVDTDPLTKALILGEREIVTPTAATINDPEVIPEVLIDNQLAGVKDRIDEVAPLFRPPLADRVDDDPPTTIVYGYDPDDNVLILEDENDSETFTLFDAINRRQAERVFRSEGNPPTRDPDDFSLDPFFAPAPVDDPSNPSDTFPAVIGSNHYNYEYDGLSRLTQATDNNNPGAPENPFADPSDDSTVTYAYDSLSRVIEETQQIGALPVQVISSAWSAENLRVGLTYPNDRRLNYTYDGLDRLKSITDDGEAEAIVEYDYIGVGRVLERRSPTNDTRMTYLNDAGDTASGYDGLRRTVELRHLRDADDSLIVGFQYGYDRMNNRLFKRLLHDPANSELYSYDSVYRLIDFQRGELNAQGDAIITPSTDALQAQEWDLDGVGNWDETTLTDEGGMVTVEDREHSSFNELIDREDGPPEDHFYDDNGNLIEDKDYLYEWDSRNRLRRATRKVDGVVGEYFYDAMGRRIRKDVSNSGALNGVTDFYYDGQRVVEERDGSNVLTQQYVYGNYIDEVLVMDRNLDGDDSAIGAADRRFHYHQDALSSVYAVTDETGQILESYLYDPYGNVTVFDENGDPVPPNPWGTAHSAIGNPYLFTGRRFDEETGLYYYRARYYDDEQGRFISRDPVGYAASGLGLYEYVKSMVTMTVDPLGLGPKSPNIKWREEVTREEFFEIRGIKFRGFTDITVWLFEMTCECPKDLYLLKFETAAGAGYSKYSVTLPDASSILPKYAPKVHERMRQAIYDRYFKAAYIVLAIVDILEEKFTSQEKCECFESAWEDWANKYMRKKAEVGQLTFALDAYSVYGQAKLNEIRGNLAEARLEEQKIRQDVAKKFLECEAIK